MIDNASSDRTISVLKTIPEIELVANPRNYGLAVATCQAEKIARGELLLVTNPDIVFNETTKRLFDHAETHPDDEIMAPSLISDAKGAYHNVPHFHRFPFLLGFISFGLLNKTLWHFLTKHYESWPKPKKQRTFDPSQVVDKHGKPEGFDDTKAYGACCILIRKSALDKIGGFYRPQYFLAFSDADWGMRMGRAHIKGGHVNGAEVYHYGGGSMSKLDRKFFYYILGRDQGRFEKDWGHWTQHFLLYFLDTIVLTIISRLRYTDGLKQRILYLKGWSSW